MIVEYSDAMYGNFITIDLINSILFYLGSFEK